MIPIKNNQQEIINHYTCDMPECDGEAMNQGEAPNSNNEYHHICNSCGAEYWIKDKEYPFSEFIEVPYNG